MGQLTLARFRGDTTFVLTARIIMTFFGGLTGMVMWYVNPSFSHMDLSPELYKISTGISLQVPGTVVRMV
jgi:hypothetical protein